MSNNLYLSTGMYHNVCCVSFMHAVRIRVTSC